jgi:hypothetical protein
VKRFWEAIAIVGASLAIVRIVLLIARLVGVIGAFDQLLIWAGFEESVLIFEEWFDAHILYVLSFVGV